MADIWQRKADHIDIALTKRVTMARSTGFDDFDLVHQALPEIDLADVSLHVTFLGHVLSAPILVSSMTGGTERSYGINVHLAEAVRELGLAMAVGSQRITVEDPLTCPSFAVARAVAPNIPLYGNLGAVQLNYGMGVDAFRQAAEAIRADGMFLHLNPLQEAIQLEGNTNFSRLLSKIRILADHLPVPLLAKEVGSGIAPEIAVALAESHIKGIDVSGAGGTSWAHIEGLRATDLGRQRLAEVFANWGIPTAESLALCRGQLPGFPLIASGGIRNGLEAAKALALGADLIGLAHPLLEPATRSTEAVIEALKQFIWELRVAMFLVGAVDLETLKSRPVVKRGYQ